MANKIIKIEFDPIYFLAPTLKAKRVKWGEKRKEVKDGKSKRP